MNKKILTISMQTGGHGAFKRQQRMVDSLIRRGYEVIWIAPPGYIAPGVNIIPLSFSKLPNIAFFGLYIKLFATFVKNRKKLQNVRAVFSIREYDALCMATLPFLRRTLKVFLSRGDTISILKVNSPDNRTIHAKIKLKATLILYPFIQRLVLQLSGIVVVQAQFLLKMLQDRHSNLNFNAIVLRNDCRPIVSTNKSNASAYNKLHVTTNNAPLNLAFIAPLYWECKGLGVIVDMINELDKRGFSYIFHIAGDGPDKERLYNALSKFSLEKKIIWHGWIEDIGALVTSVDIIIAPSLYDSNPNLILEAIAYDKPILASDIAAHKEMLVYDELLFENKNIKNLCDKIELFSTNDENRDIIYRRIYERKKILSFDWDMEFVRIIESNLNKDW
jgi:glycosyltransferase involved in cell wall biosynthesis